MVHISKAFIVVSIITAPALAIPVTFDIPEEILRRDPNWFKKIGGAIGGFVKKAAPIVSKVGSIAKKVAPFAKFIPGPVGAVASLASFIPREELEAYAREISKELAARDELVARGLDDDDILYLRQFVDAEDLGIRSYIDDELDLRELLDASFEAREPEPEPEPERHHHPRDLLYDADLD